MYCFVLLQVAANPGHAEAGSTATTLARQQSAPVAWR